MFQSLQILALMLGARLRGRDERGASAVEWVVITALLIGIATVVGGILFSTIQDGAEGIELGL